MRRLDIWPTTTGLSRPRAGDAAAGGAPDVSARGACVPYETPALFAARVRPDDRDGLSLLLRNFATSNATYVMPWSVVPATIPMTQRDRALHIEVERTRALTPRAMRDAARAVAASGCAGPEAQQAVKRAMAEERRRLTELQAAVLVRALRAAGAAPQEDLRSFSDTPQALRAAAAALRLPPARLFATAEAIAQELLPVGLPPGPPDAAGDGGAGAQAERSGVAPGDAEADPAEPDRTEVDSAGPLRRMATQLGHFARHLEQRLEVAPSEARPQYERAATAAATTVRHSDQTFARIDREIGNMHLLLTAWPERRDRLRRELDQIYWLLDGWEPTIEHYTQKLTDWLTLSQEHTLAILASLPRAGAGVRRQIGPDRD